VGLSVRVTGTSRWNGHPDSAISFHRLAKDNIPPGATPVKAKLPPQFEALQKSLGQARIPAHLDRTPLCCEHGLLCILGQRCLAAKQPGDSQPLFFVFSCLLWARAGSEIDSE
jgi:hypothetical protein